MKRFLQIAIMAALLLGIGNVQTQASSGASKDIVDPYQVYTYELMNEQLDQLAAAYPDLIELKTIGKTAYNREIRAAKLGKGEATILIDGSQHAREWMGTNLIMYMIDRYAYAYEHNMKYNDYVVRQLLDQVSIWFVPMVNPDGVTLQQQGLNAFPGSSHAYLLSMNGGSYDFGGWKASAEGVDINRQYPAMWSDIRNSPPYPMFKNFKGYTPGETAEASTMMEFTYGIDPEIALSYHTSGEVLYWHFHTLLENMARDKKIADTISYMTGYSQMKPEKNPSGGGFTDWFITEFGRPGFTAELGPYQVEDSLPLWTFTEIWEQNEELGLYLAAEGYKLWQKRYPVEFVDQKLQIFGDVQLYNRASGSFPTGAWIHGSKMTSDAQLGNWHRVSTWMGPKWVYLTPASFVQGHSEEYKEKITLTSPASLYEAPNSDASVLGQLSPQVIETLERWKDWVLVRTWLGNSWIHLTN